MQPRRVRRACAAAWPKAVAGSIDSSSGSASVTPTPFRKVRRERCFFVRKFMSLYLHTFLELVGVDDAHEQRREPVAIGHRAMGNRTNLRHVGVPHRTTNRVGHELFGDSRDER